MLGAEGVHEQFQRSSVIFFNIRMKKLVTEVFAATLSGSQPYPTFENQQILVHVREAIPVATLCRSGWGLPNVWCRQDCLAP